MSDDWECVACGAAFKTKEDRMEHTTISNCPEIENRIVLNIIDGAHALEELLKNEDD